MDVKTVLRVVLFSAAGLALGCATPPTHTAATQPTVHVIADPQSYAAEVIEKNLGQAGKLDTSYDDLDGDGVPELFIIATDWTGNGGAPQLVFRKTPAGYVLLGELFMHPKGYRVLPPNAQGEIRLVVYERLGGSEGNILWMVQRNEQFVIEKSERVTPGDSGTAEGRQRLAEVFGWKE